MASPITDLLFDDLQEKEFVYAVLDGASIPNLLDHLYSETPPAFECLYRGELDPDIAEIAPYLVRIERDSEFADWVVSGWGKHWGVFLTVAADLDAMRHHFRRFLTVHDPTGKPLLFRYYDPRVLRGYLPTCSAEELQTVFGSIRSYLLEGESPKTAIRFRGVSGTLQTDTLPIQFH